MRQHIERWLGLLASGVLENWEDEEAIDAAIEIVGEARLSELREWVAQQSHATIQGLDATAIEVCIWMARADGEVSEAERLHIEELIAASHLDAETDARVREAWERRPNLVGLAERLPHPVLRELLLVLAWQTAFADGRLDRVEQGGELLLSTLLAVPDERAYALRRALGSMSRLPPAPTLRTSSAPKRG
jgi:uncharacterized tellurite resistance protein B-like protein